MKNKYLVLFSILSFFFLTVWSESVTAQFTIPPDTTTYWVKNESGVTVEVRRPADSTMIKGQLIIRFHENALDYTKLIDTYNDWYFDPYTAHGNKGNRILSGPAFPCDSNRGFPDSLKYYLKSERFYIDSSTNIILNPALKTFLHGVGGIYLRRLTTASPIDKYSITRRGDTIGCDHYNWMVLSYDTATNPLLLSYILTREFPKDIFFAEPDRKGGRLLHTKPSHPHDNTLYYDRCEYSLHDMINAPKAWDYEVGNPKIVIALFDRGADFMHPDLGAGLGLGKHVRFGEQFTLNKIGHTVTFDPINKHQAHGTPCLGIIGALTNRNATSVAGIAGGWGVLPSDLIDTIDEGMGCSLAILAASNFGQDVGDSYSDYVAAVFQASAKSDSSEYGYGVNVINTSAVVINDNTFGGGDAVPSLHGAINFAFLNGVVQVASISDNGNNETAHQQTWPADYEEPWMISVGGSQPNKSLILGSNFGYTMDLIAPAGDPTHGDSITTDNCSNIQINCFKNGNWDETFTTWNLQQDMGLLEITNPCFNYNGFGGTSAAAPHVTGSAGLVLSTFLKDTSIKLEPEDVAGMLKASAFRPAGVRSHKDSTGYGHLDIGHLYEMLDPIPGSSTENLYFIRHFHFEDSLQYGAWSKDSIGWYFDICWNPNIQFTDSFKNKFGKWDYILNSSGGGQSDLYYAKVRTVARSVTLDTLWDIDSISSPLFAWGRSGGIGQKSGWNFSQYNFQTGWSRVTNGIGGDTLNEGIFHSQSKTFTIVTAQYDVWAWDDSTAGYSKYIGHVPNDTSLGVNFTVFGRRNLNYNSVRSQQSSGNENLLVSVSPEGNRLNAWYFTDRDVERPKLEVYDILGRFITSFSEQYALKGWNTIQCPLNLQSGTYICRISGSGFTQSKSFQVIK